MKKDDIGNALFQQVCNTTNPLDPTETLKTVGKDIQTNDVTDIDSFFDAAQGEFWVRDRAEFGSVPGWLRNGSGPTVDLR